MKKTFKLLAGILGLISLFEVLQEINKQTDFASLVYDFPAQFSTGLQLGASVAQNGVCLTVRTLKQNTDGSMRVSFDVIAQTLKLTNLADLKSGDAVNIERAACFGDEIGGHVVSGHVFGCVRVLSIEQDELNMRLVFERPAELKPYLLNKDQLT